MSALRQDIEFKTLDGVILRGWFYSPRQDTAQPCIIMASGLGGLKEQFLPDFAERFQTAGYGVLVYDHRNFGASDGLPRKECDPTQQARDYSDAFDFAASLPEVDRSQIIFWGSSMSGSAAIYAAAFDKRIRAAVFQVPFVSGEAKSELFSKHLAALYENRCNIKAGKPGAVLQVFAQNSKDAKRPDCTAMVNEPGIIPFLEELERRNIHWEGAVTAQTILNIISCEPMAFIHRIAPTPFLMVVSDNDVEAVTAAQLKAYASAYEPKRITVLHDADHFKPYFGPTFEENINAQLNFLNEVLGKN
ncbi:alpha/beta hydrolase [Aspergillus alliaceus]|uniref:alpha/beta hydrolase n=1 Tax=Petromyces alliaceus TaxID=209559 RepID=UPI0012A6FF06|nr:alpha/beta superfamily hydrolase [Aspergillus alliaceus]KAB8230812.1 alpha/beta superfamily hydrolase [Aspergillus alliaceus]